MPAVEGPIHRYIEASPSCWALFSALVNAGEPPLAPAPQNTLLVDAYAVQHPGTPSDQSIQSVGVHLVTLYGVFRRDVSPGQALGLRSRAARDHKRAKDGRFRWLAPPSLSEAPTIADVAEAPTPAARAKRARHYVESVWALWWERHGAVVAGWYDSLFSAD